MPPEKEQRSQPSQESGDRIGEAGDGEEGQQRQVGEHRGIGVLGAGDERGGEHARALGVLDREGARVRIHTRQEQSGVLRGRVRFVRQSIEDVGREDEDSESHGSQEQSAQLRRAEGAQATREEWVADRRGPHHHGGGEDEGSVGRAVDPARGHRREEAHQNDDEPEEQPTRPCRQLGRRTTANPLGFLALLRRFAEDRNASVGALRCDPVDRSLLAARSNRGSVAAFRAREAFRVAWSRR